MSLLTHRALAAAIAEAPPEASTLPGLGEGFGVDAIFAPLEPVPYLIAALDIAPGAPTLFGGTSFAGKTACCQSLALSVATGKPAWGYFSVARTGRVVHVDYEQGRHLTHERYQRLARGMGIEPSELRDKLRTHILPRMTLSAPNALDELQRVADGAALVIVDSLRACAGDLDENSSEIRLILDLLSHMSEKTGAVGAMIAHTKKPQADQMGGARTSIRGSSAIFDSCSSVLVLTGAKNEPTRVEHEKARISGVLADDFELVIENVEVGGDPRAGLRVRVSASEPAAERVARLRQAHNEELERRLLAFVGTHPRCSLRDVRASVEGRGADKDAALTRLVLAGRLAEESGARRARTFVLAGGSNA